MLKEEACAKAVASARGTLLHAQQGSAICWLPYRQPGRRVTRSVLHMSTTTKSSRVAGLLEEL